MAKQLKKTEQKPKQELGEDNGNFSVDTRVRVLKNGLTFNQDTYEYDDSFTPSSPITANSAHTTAELMYLLEHDKKIEIDAKVLCVNRKENLAKFKTIKGRDKFIEAFKEGNKKLKMRETDDFFGADLQVGGGGSIVDSQDFTPLLGGPFYKQLYQYDYLRMHANCFYAWHHDPIAKSAIEMIVDFVLGRGFRVECENEEALILWEAFSKVNDIPELTKQILREFEAYGEFMIWKLPKGQTKITYQLRPDQKPPLGIIPRIRLIDPSCIWEIVTYPEDITRVLYYQWIAPTQYQTYTAPEVPTTKFIFEQVPADQVIHRKINIASNEKRGRSDLFASMGYLKRLRDSVNYSIIGMQKAAAWAIDTQIRGSEQDINNYVQSQQQQGTLASAGSEFVHSEAVTRTYLSNSGASRGGHSTAFDWCLSMVAAGLRIPISYFGTHLSGGQTRASALVSTEPVAKMFESRQTTIESLVKDLFEWLTGEECEVIFPEIISQDSTAKIRNIVVADSNEYISKERAAGLVAKELNITDFDYEEEKKKILAEQKEGLDITAPLTTGGMGSEPNRPSAVTGTQRSAIGISNGY